MILTDPPHYGDSKNTLLLKIATLVQAGHGGGALPDLPEITRLDFTGVDSSTLANPGGPGKAFVISGATERYGPWFQVTDETQPDLSAYGVTQYIMMNASIAPSGNEVAQLVKDALISTDKFQGGETEGAVWVATDHSVGTRVDAVDVNTGAIITVTQQGRGTTPAHTLEFTTQPGDASNGSPFGQQPVVRALDLLGDLDTSFTGNVTISIYSGDGTLSGTVTKAAVAGVATFTDLEIELT